VAVVNRDRGQTGCSLLVSTCVTKWKTPYIYCRPGLKFVVCNFDFVPAFLLLFGSCSRGWGIICVFDFDRKDFDFEGGAINSKEEEE